MQHYPGELRVGAQRRRNQVLPVIEIASSLLLLFLDHRRSPLSLWLDRRNNHLYLLPPLHYPSSSLRMKQYYDPPSTTTTTIKAQSPPAHQQTLNAELEPRTLYFLKSSKKHAKCDGKIHDE